jgi:hypothetical protein
MPRRLEQKVGTAGRPGAFVIPSWAIAQALAKKGGK